MARTDPSHRAARFGVLWLGLVMSACAVKALPPSPTTLAFPDFLYPTATPAPADQVAAVDRGWRLLQSGDVQAARRVLTQTLDARPDFFPARTALGYVALASREYAGAVSTFDQALARAPTYAPALVGRGEALLSLGRTDDARLAFEAAVRVDASLQAVATRVAVLQFRGLQTTITRARQAREAGRLAEARTAYSDAITAAPDSPELYRERGVVERALRDTTAALADFRRAIELDPTDGVSMAQVAELLEGGQDFVGAEAAYRRAATIDPSGGFEARAAAMAAKARDASLPEEVRAIASAATVRRGDWAALVGIRFESALRAAPRAPVVVTDVRGHWAAPWIAEVVAARVMAPFDNHTFQPGAALRRADLATTAAALMGLLSSATRSALPQGPGRPTIVDVRPTHMQYAAIAATVSAGLVPLLPGGRFEPERVVSGAEAVATIDRLLAWPPSR